MWTGIFYDNNGNIEGKMLNGKGIDKDTVVEPVVQVEKRQTGVLFERKVNGILGWNEYGNKDYHAKYEGEIENGQPNGQGKWTLPNGNKYEGEWKSGKKHGQGTLNWSNGDKYEGEWKDGIKHGQGILNWSDGNKYEGEWKDGKQNGQGTYSFSNGMKYIGKFRNANYNGEGILTLPDGRKVIGEFREDKPWNVSLFDKKGNFKMKWVNGKKQ